jgi:GT2 family glycosyltransferase
VSIIILNYNGGEDVLECLASVAEIDYSNYETIVVDNGSTDNSVAEIRRRFPLVKIIENKTNLGFPAGNDVGIRASTAPYVLLLNDDVVVDRQILKDLLSAAQSHPEAGIAGPAVLYYKEPERIWAAGAKISPFGYATHLDKGKRFAIGSLPHYADYITGCALLIKRNVIERIGLLDPAYFLYFDDADYCCRARKAGFKCLYVPSPTVRHKTGAGWISNPVQAYYYMKNAVVFAKKNLMGWKRYLFVGSQIVLMLPYYSVKLLPGNGTLIKHLVRGLKDGMSYRILNSASPRG